MTRLLASLTLSLTLLLPGAAFAQVVGDSDAPEPITPQLQVDIPGLDFNGSVVVTGKTATDDCAENHTCVFTISRYLNAFFRFSMGAGILITIVMVMIGGIEWMIGSSTGNVARAKKRMQNAGIGLFLLTILTLFLAFINPNIVNVTGIQLSNVKPGTYDVYKQPSGQAAYSDALDEEGNPLNLVRIDDENISSPGQAVHKDILPDLIAVGNAMASASGTGLPSEVYIPTGHRDPARQVAVFYNNCMQGGACSKPTCNPFQEGTGPIEGDTQSGWRLRSNLQDRYETDAEVIDFLTQELIASQTYACGHLTGYAVAAFCKNDFNGAFSVNTACQETLEATMKSNGFCRHEQYPWYFEHRSNLVEVTDCGFIPGVYLRPPEVCQPTPGAVDGLVYNANGDESTCAFDYATDCRVNAYSMVNLAAGSCTR